MMSVLRNILYHHAFGAAPVKTAQLEHSKPIVAPAGLDSFAAIGSPPSVQVSCTIHYTTLLYYYTTLLIYYYTDIQY